ncbi:MAG TPA: hypothetical protein VG456_00980 [Candidatus Sulfopaludibacter sp.]|jgi:photosystem II stability/assembly factor-like uncharacterized protein|nr:hypothetical protein [Candidatus Sulfopaludibacter sp.]
MKPVKWIRPFGLAFCLSLSLFAQTNYDTVLKNLHFRSIGPATMGGRVDDFAVVESDPRIIYVGAAAGGVFKTVNGGQTWQALFEDQSNPSIGDLALAPSNPSILYVGTGEPNNRQSASWGNGVYKSMDGGATFTHLGLKETHHIGRIVVHPTDPNTVFVAAQGDLWGPNKERGVYMSTDGGAHWNQTLFINEDTGVNDIAIDMQSPNILYASAYERRRTVFGFDGGGPGSGIYRSTDGGLHWTRLGAPGGPGRGLPATGDMGRIGLDIYRKNTNIVYALVEHGTLGGVYRSEDKGATWARMGDTNPRPSYFSQIRIDPNNDQKLWLGGVNMYMSEDGGRTFVQTRFRDVHSDVHGIWIDPANSDHMLSGNDGGVWVTWDSGRNWRHIDNIALGQFYEVAFDYQKPYHVCGGLQDNYSWCGPSSTLQQTGIANDDWITVQGGDGFYNRIDPSDPNIIYAESQDGSLSRRDMRTSESKSIRPIEPTDTEPRYRFQWNSPLMISPHDPKTIYYGGNHLFKSTDRGDTWQVLGEDLTTGAKRDEQKILGKVPGPATLSRHDGVVAWPCITAIAESPKKAGVLWAGTDDGNVQISRDGGKTWQNVVSHMAGAPKGGYVSRIEPSWQDEGTAYITFDNHRSADYAIYIYKTINYGDSFSRISNGIPPEAGTVHVIREDPTNKNLLFAGTEFGIFLSFDRGGAWHKLKNGLPTVPVFDIQIHPRDHDLIVATHGRSIWIMDNIRALEGFTDQVLTSDLKLLDARPGIEWKMANYRGFQGSSNFFATNAPTGVLVDYWAKTAGPVRLTVADKAGKQIRQMNARAEAGVVNRVVWDMRMDSPIPPAGGAGAAGGGGRGAGGGGRAGRGGGRGAAADAPPATSEVAAGEIANEFGAEAGGRGAGGGGGGGGGGRGFGGAGRGSLVDPGDYVVTISLAGKTDTQTVKVEDDPRVQMSDDDRAKRRKAVDTLISLTKEADTGRRRSVAMTTALTSLTDSWKTTNAAPVPDEVKKAADDLLKRVKTAAAVFENQGGGRGGAGGSAGPPPPYTPPPVTQKIARLMQTIDGYSAAPNAKQLADIEDASATVQKGLVDVNKLWDEVPKFNKMMSDAGVQYFKVDLNSVPAAAPGGRGGGQ